MVSPSTISRDVSAFIIYKLLFTIDYIRGLPSLYFSSLDENRDGVPRISAEESRGNIQHQIKTSLLF